MTENFRKNGSFLQVGVIFGSLLRKIGVTLFFQKSDTKSLRKQAKNVKKVGFRKTRVGWGVDTGFQNTPFLDPFLVRFWLYY